MDLTPGCQLVAAAQRSQSGDLLIPNRLDAGICWGFFGALQQITRYGTADNERHLDICNPPESTRLQLVLVFLSYIQANPAELHNAASDVAVVALQRAFPCRR